MAVRGCNNPVVLSGNTGVNQTPASMILVSNGYTSGESRHLNHPLAHLPAFPPGSD